MVATWGRWLALTFWLLSSAAAVAQTDSQAEQAATKAQLQQIATELKRRQQALDQRSEQLSLTERELQQLERQIASIANELNHTATELAATVARIKDLQQQQQQLEQQQQQQLELLAEQIDTAYRLGKHDYLKLLLQQQEPSKIERVLGYYRYFNEARMQQLEQLQATYAQLEQVRADVDEQQAKQQQQLAEQRQQQGVLQQQQQQQQQLIARLNREQQADQQAISQLRQNQEALEQVLAAIIAAMRNEPQLNGLAELKRQLQWPAEGKVQRVFGTARSGGLQWKGVIIDAADGTPVTAIADGRVLFANWLRGYGLLLVLDHGDGYMSLYGHNQTILPAEGDIVRRNETIALVGQSGGRESPALYFEIRVKGDAVNPTQWCR
ncbi:MULTISPECIES: murein hydrolase activator EnvC [Pseudidiomarina]|uniref:Septal ring factor EnvC (AmiA/AmiB activator) n=2 Tax=Pseudidiomarina TaxID=2800384 RepID=A0A368UMW5_9GAMM|nr:MULTISPECIES: peptidoglycan DD-metalloendopeptidase family protein [Pseudidiomarina]PWW09342.1 septal ring factor EnvC (AmiA/AmiB activator) [Pseudidiomarina maritima]RBP87329.1 septal ring factor EnvC (AmiA/AmiB activator) [Pseudidiomarina tainanensis]RCW29360.1 septal ring factor EnvC (AmiA/AmiB activator) [Pseudidiomarina tainanensis]